MDPSEVVEFAAKAGCRSISYTYTEPTIYYEYALDCAKLAKERGISNNFVTNGYIEEEPLKAIRPYLDGANIDLKGFTEDFYKKVCGADLNKVLATIRHYRALGIWIELTTLVIPGYNDKEEEFRAIAQFIKNDLGAEIPWHVSAFYPTYRLTDAPRTTAKTLRRAREIGLEAGLRYVYTGNIPGADGEHTYCWSCKKLIIGRYGYTISEYNIKDGSCIFCSAIIDGVGL
jgi:pyruvate formate lyase activating enzyme